ncbi:uncharacterized protein LOC143363281 [Halictus rubicundus]|uniref:uncharacterized protein LOC143363281 n=1 Tax=Halictus rubicundus TaxID=77578 RepID=UPI004035946A
MEDIVLHQTGILQLEPSCKGYTDLFVLETTSSSSRNISHYVPKLDITTDDCCLLKRRFNKTVPIQLTPVKLTNIDLTELRYANKKLSDFDKIVTDQLNKPFIVQHTKWYTIGLSVLEKIGASVAACSTAGGSGTQTQTPNLVEVVPEFNGSGWGEDANAWCELVEEITKHHSGQRRLCLATHAMRGSAMKWYQEWKGQPRTWDKFKEDLCNVFVSEKKLHEKLLRAVTYTSDSAVTYAEYARTKLSHLEQTRINFKVDELVELIVGAITNEGVRQSVINGQYKSTSDLIVGQAQFTKSSKNRRPTEEFVNRFQDQRPPRKRCFTCDEPGHLRHECPTKKKSLTHNDISSRVPVCKFCSKRGHEEANCWAKQRLPARNRESQRAEANVCSEKNSHTTPVLIKDVLVHCLFDSGADCSLIKEDTAQRVCVNVVPYGTSVRGLGGAKVTTVGRTTAVIQTEDVAVELDFFVIKNVDMVYDVIVGRNVLRYQDLQMVTDANGSRLQRINSPPLDQERTVQCCNIVEACDEEVREPLERLLQNYQHLVSSEDTSRCVTTGELTIRTKGEQVVSYHPYRLSYTEREKVRTIVDDLLRSKVIRESVSPFASPIILVKKKNGKDRMCVDYRALNRSTIKDRYPLPLIDDQLDRLGRGKYFTTLDMASGFHQIPIADDSIEKTAFVTPDGHYEYLRMPFGLCNAPAVFQRAINKALGNLRNTVALVYLDDILIPSQTIEEGFVNLEKVLDALSTAGFTLNIEKCSFFKKSIEYLGREISADGIRPGKSKLKALIDSPVPSNVKQIRQFMGLASYFRKFVPEFASRTSCITRLVKQGEPWNWGPEQDRARCYVIEKLSSQPLLTIFDPTRETELHTDASSLGYGAILFQSVQATGAPRANGQAERYVSTIVNLLTAELSRGTEWPSKLSKIQLSLNTTIQKSTGFSPTRLLFGVERSAG